MENREQIYRGLRPVWWRSLGNQFLPRETAARNRAWWDSNAKWRESTRHSRRLSHSPPRLIAPAKGTELRSGLALVPLAGCTYIQDRKALSTRTHLAVLPDGKSKEYSVGRVVAPCVDTQRFMITRLRQKPENTSPPKPAPLSSPRPIRAAWTDRAVAEPVWRAEGLPVRQRSSNGPLPRRFRR